MEKKKEKTPVVTRDIPYVRCYNESGMIETSFGVFSKCYEILSPTRQRELTYSSKKVRECMKSIFLAFRDLSFQFVIHNSPTDKEEYGAYDYNASVCGWKDIIGRRGYRNR